MKCDTWINTWMKHMDVMRHMDEHIDETHGYGHAVGDCDVEECIRKNKRYIETKALTFSIQTKHKS